jgi:hypothetical protein
MKRHLLSIIAIFILSLSAMGQTVYEPFTGTGNLNGSNGWIAYSGTANQVQYVATAGDAGFGNSLGIPSFPSSLGNRIALSNTGSEDLIKAIPDSNVGTVRYISALVKATNLTGLNATGDYSLAFGNSYTFGLTVFGCRFFVRQSATAGKINFGIVNHSGTGSTSSFITTDYDTGRTYLVVMKYDRSTSPNQTASLWINPATGWASEPTANLVNSTGSNTLAQFGAIVLRQGTSTGNVQYDEIRVSSTWDIVAQLPVELVSFNASVVNGAVELNWQTASELNNSGFNVERRGGNGEWTTLGFVRGNGTTTEAKSYRFVDATAAGAVQYRLKQIDFDGQFEYSPIVEVNAAELKSFKLAQNFPNPFNPTTVIGYQLPTASVVSLKIYDMIGREVAVLANERKDAGSYSATFNSAALPSGMYFYRLQAGSFTETRKMMLVK